MLSTPLGGRRRSPYVIARDHRYYLTVPEGSWIDVPVFEEFCRRGEKLLYDRQINESLICHNSAERIYTGTLFATLPAEYADNIDNDWCWSRRFWLEKIYVKMLTRMSSIYRELGDPGHAIAHCDRALKIDPCFELAHQEIMQAYHALGRREAVERQYQLCCGALKRQEERTPLPETRRLYQGLLAEVAGPRRLQPCEVERRKVAALNQELG